jgi:uncharacterized protein YecE (DUF72 family)
MSQIRIGISGWRYKPWRGTFYPDDLPQKNELHYASRALPTIEINGTFYSLQRPKNFVDWYEQTPDDFVFSVKGSRYITHLKRLRDIVQPLANFFAQGLLRLNEKLGPILWQFPPNFKFDEALLDAFFTLLPRTTSDAAVLAKGHDKFMKNRVWLKTARNRPVRHAIEIRHDSFKDERFVKLLRRHKVALVVADTAGKWPLMEDVTSDFIYIRLHGDEQLYVSGYTDDALESWAKKIRAWANGHDAPDAKRVGAAAVKRKSRDVYVYFDNDVKVRAPFDAANLAIKLGLREEPLKPGVDTEITEEPRTHWPSQRRRKRSS